LFRDHYSDPRQTRFGVVQEGLGYLKQSGVWYGPEKSPIATLDYSINWAAWLRGDSIAYSTWGTDQGLTVNNSGYSHHSTTVWLAGGTPGQTYTVTNTIRTAAGRSRQMTFKIRIAWQ
jgi:hypothetical protein